MNLKMNSGCSTGNKPMLMNVTRCIKFIIIMLPCWGYGQAGGRKPVTDTTALVFKDTLYNLAFDSLKHDLGEIIPRNENNRLTKHFIYVGNEPMSIIGTWTSDPHFICDWPKGPLIPYKVYAYTVCFWHEGRQGSMHKEMGFYLSNGEKITLIFTGKYSAVERVK